MRTINRSEEVVERCVYNATTCAYFDNALSTPPLISTPLSVTHAYTMLHLCMRTQLAGQIRHLRSIISWPQNHSDIASFSNPSRLMHSKSQPGHLYNNEGTNQQPTQCPRTTSKSLSSTSSPSCRTTRPKDKQQLMRSFSGFQQAGFIYIKNHGISKPDVRTAFEESAKFFKRPKSQKDALAWTTAEANRGYVQQGREKTTDLTDPADIEAKRAEEGADLKESLEIGREGVPGLPNRWPDSFDEEGKDFRERLLVFFDQCKDLHVQVMRAIAVGLGIDETWFDAFCDGGDNTLRLLHYPSVNADVFKKNKNTVRAGAHTDYGEIASQFLQGILKLNR